ncbi:MAG: VWA domain-containing protein [Deltaproteobacteria bacterium]
MKFKVATRFAPSLFFVFASACGGLGAYDDTSIAAPDNTGGNPNNPNAGNNTNVNLGGAQDFGYFRRLLDANQVPRPDDVDDAGFFAEHHTPLPEPECGERVCGQAMLGVMANLINGNNCTLLQVGLNSPLAVDPDNRPPLNLAIVVDVSGSMSSEGKMDFVKSGLMQMVNELYDDDRIAIVAYSGDAEVRFEMAEVRGARNRLREVVDGLVPGGSTNLWGGLELGYQQVLQNYDIGLQNRVILLSDGQPTAGVTGPAQILENSRAYNSDGVGLTTIGLGTSFNYALMRDLSLQGDGNAYFVEDASAVEEVFTEELAYFTVPVAFDLEIEVEAGADYRFRNAYGSSLFEHDLTSGRLSIPSVFLAHRTSHDDVTEGNGRRGGGSALLLELMPNDDVAQDGDTDVAGIVLSYRVPGQTERVTQALKVAYPHPADVLLREGFFDNDIVTKSFVMLNILVGMREATDLFHRGQGADGVDLLRRLIAAVADYEDGVNDGEGDVDMQLDIALLEQLADVMIANGAIDRQAPVEEDPWPRD